MSIWALIADVISRATSSALAALLEAVRTVFSGDKETRAKVAFSIAIIALSAKMAKADGVVSDAEVRAFQKIFTVPPEEFDNVAAVYNLAKQDVAGFDAYGRQVADLFHDEPRVLEDVLDALFFVAGADGVVHENELALLQMLAGIFSFSDEEFERIRLSHVSDGDRDPYLVLGAQRDWDFERLKSHHRDLVRENHPDRLLARGVPEEFMNLAQDRMAAINSAWDEIKGLNKRQALPKSPQPKAPAQSAERV
jgi:DnaJ like chaperone protein